MDDFSCHDIGDPRTHNITKSKAVRLSIKHEFLGTIKKNIGVIKYCIRNTIYNLELLMLYKYSKKHRAFLSKVEIVK